VPGLLAPWPADEIHCRLVERVRALAKAKGLQLSHVPDLAGVTRSHFWDVLGSRKSPTLAWLSKVAEALSCEPWELLFGGPRLPPPPAEGHHVPLMSLSVAAGGFTESTEVVQIGWVTVPPEREVKEGMFAATVSGKSMEPLIPAGSTCLFRPLEDRDPDGRVLLVQLRGAQDPETGGRYTVKKLRVARREEQVWQVRLEPLNRDFEALELEEDPMSQLLPVAELVEVLARAPA